MFVLRLFHEIRTLFLGLLFTLAVIPVFIVLCLPLYLFRFVIASIGPWVHPKLSKVLPARSSVLAWDDIFHKPRSTLLTAVVIQGDPPLDHVREQMLKHVVYFSSKRDSGSDPSINCSDAKSCLKVSCNLPPRDTLAYPEFQQCCVSWMGYLFWKWDKNFSIYNHVNDLPTPEGKKSFSEADVAQIRLDLVKKPFSPTKSPWEMYIVRNYCPGSGNRDTEGLKSMVILRVHHLMSDGYSLLQLFMTQMLGEQISKGKLEQMSQIPRPKFHQRGLWASGVTYGVTLALLPYRFVRNQFECRDENEFHRKARKLSRNVYPAKGNLPLEVIQNVRRSHSEVTSFTAVLLAMIAGGVRKFMRQHGMEVPKIIRLASPLPRREHPKSLCNYWTFCVVKLPTGVQCPEQRLRMCEKEWQKSKTSAKPPIHFALIPMIGSLPQWLAGYFVKNRVTTAILSNFPGPASPAQLFGHRVLDLSFGGGLGHGALGLGFAFLSYNGMLNLSLGIDQSILKTQKEAQQLMDCVVEEADVLLKCQV